MRKPILWTAAAFLIFASVSAGQDVFPELNEPTDATTTGDPVPPDEPSPTTVPWTYERQQQNTAGTVTNTHRGLENDDGELLLREHIVTNPHGQLTQRWEQVETEDGYEMRRTQTWTDPEGNLLRTQEQIHGTDESGATSNVVSTQKSPWWQSLNPFGKTRRDKGGTASTVRRGFSIGTRARNSTGAGWNSDSRGSSTVRGSQNVQRASWAGGAPRSIRADTAGASQRSTSAVGRNGGPRPQPGRGPKR